MRHCATPCASAAKKACRRKLVLVDGKVGRTAHVASAAAEISVLARVEAGPAPGSGRRALARPEEQLAVLFEDDHLAVVAKPAGVDVPALRTLLAASLAHFPPPKPLENVVGCFIHTQAAPGERGTYEALAPRASRSSTA